MDRNTYLKEMLNEVPDYVDKTQGSPIFISLSPVAYMLSVLDNELEGLRNLSYIDTAEKEFLDRRIEEFGYYRLLETNAKKKVFLYDDNDVIIENINIGSRFSCNNIGFTIVEFKKDYYIAECDNKGSIGNAVTGEIVNINGLNSVAKGILSETIIPARDTETDEAFKERFIEFINRPPFGGNKTDYIEKTLKINGVGSCKVIPIWNGGGTVKVIIQDSTFQPPTTELVEYVQNIIDPNQEGLGKGTAPIGHKVTVTGAKSLDLKIECKIKLMDKYTIEAVKPEIIKNIDTYLENIRRKWWKMQSDELVNIKITCAIAGSEGVFDVSDVKMNDILGNLPIQNEEIPVLKELIING